MVIKTKEFKKMFAQFKKICMHVQIDIWHWYSIEKTIKRIGSVRLKCIGNVWLKRIGSVWLKGYW